MAAKQEVVTEAAEGVVPVSTRARAPSAGMELKNPPLGAPPDALRGRPHGYGGGRSGLAR